MIFCIEETQTIKYLPAFVALCNVFAIVGIGFFNYQFIKRKDLEDKIYDGKLKVYKEINEIVYNLIKDIKVQGFPLYGRDNSSHKEMIKTFFQIEYENILIKIIECEKKGQHYLHFIPNRIFINYFNLITNCQIYIHHGKEFNYDMLLIFKERVIQDYYSLIDILREDLNIDTLDNSLKKRLKSL